MYVFIGAECLRSLPWLFTWMSAVGGLSQAEVVYPLLLQGEKGQSKKGNLEVDA